MKTLIFNGSPRRKGDTASMLDYFMEELGGEIKVVDAYFADIKPCIDCRWCFEHPGCARKDDMQEVFDYIQECDHILMASPIYFGEITGVLLAILSRLQTYFSARYLRKEDPVPKKKTGGILLAGGSFGPREKAEDTASMLLEQLGCTSLGTVYVDHTDEHPAMEQPQVREQLADLARKLKEGEKVSENC